MKIMKTIGLVVYTVCFLTAYCVILGVAAAIVVNGINVTFN